MEYIYESPDNGKTIYRTVLGDPDSKRELIKSDTVHIETFDDFIVILDKEG